MYRFLCVWSFKKIDKDLGMGFMMFKETIRTKDSSIILLPGDKSFCTRAFL